MSTHTRARTKRQLRHPASRSQSHQRDKREGEARKQKQWVEIQGPPRPNTERAFPGLAGHEYIYEAGQWRRCDDPEEFADFMERIAERRNWYKKKTQRKGVEVEMKRPATALEIQTTTFAPWLSDWTAAEIAAGRDPRKILAAIRDRWLHSAHTLLTDQRALLAYAFHADTDDLHFDLILTRQDGKGGRIGGAGLGLVGPWCVGVDRQLRAGAQISSVKRSQMKRSVENFRYREGEEAVPLDVQLARALDAAADGVVGKELQVYREAYAQRVPQLEREHALAQLATLRAAQEKLRASLEPTPQAEPAPEPHLSLL